MERIHLMYVVLLTATAKPLWSLALSASTQIYQRSQSSLCLSHASLANCIAGLALPFIAVLHQASHPT